MFQLIINKIRNKKLLNSSLLAGVILLGAFLCIYPMFLKGSLNRLLQTLFTDHIRTENEYPAVLCRDETVSFEVNWPSDSYVLDSVTVSWSGGTITPGQSGNDEIEDDFITRTYTFDMPAGDATVKAVFREYVELYVGEPLVGVADVKVNGDEASMNDLYFYPLSGSEVTLTIQPHAGYRIANDGDGVSIYYGDHNAYVTMAGENT